jgi:hypothetical protein
MLVAVAGLQLNLRFMLLNKGCSLKIMVPGREKITGVIFTNPL